MPELGFDLYPWFAIGASICILALFTAHVADAGRAYRTHRDDRAALDLLVALTLAIAALGLTASAAAAFIDAIGVAGRSELRNIGLGIVRGALLVTAATMFLIDRQMARLARRARSAR